MIPGTGASATVLYVGASTKMYLGYRASIDWLTAIAAEVERRPELASAGVVPFVVPSYPVLESAARILADTPVRLGAQDVATGAGPLTGEVSAGMLAELGVTIAEVGHAERRRLFGDTDEVVAQKLRAATDAGLTPLLCVGEDRAGDPAQAIATVVDQCRAAAEGETPRLARSIIAYEPLWAIGTETAAPADHANAVAAGIRTALAAVVDPVPPVIYGGSAGPGLLSTLGAADGVFLGRFAHEAAAFGTVLDEALQRRAPFTDGVR